MRFLALFCAATLCGLAQTPAPTPPKKVDDGLRARVTQFHQDQLAGSFRKSLNLVAEDSQDYFLSMSKERAKGFTIDHIEYREKFTKAAVRIASTNRLLVGSRTVDVPSSMVEYWKIEGGKWFWYHDPEADRPNFFGLPIGGSSGTDPNLGKSVPKDTEPQTIVAGAQAALQVAENRPMFDSPSVTFALGEPGTKELHVRNNYKGTVHLVVSLPDEQTGVTVDPLLADIEGLGEVVLKIQYHALYKQPGITRLVLQLQPFPRLYSFEVSVDAAKPAAQ